MSKNTDVVQDDRPLPAGEQTYDEDRPGWLWTYSGLRFWPRHPRACDVSIVDIAHHLSMLCRYSGAMREYYSVAEHCVRVSLWCDPGDSLAGLLHDAAEAYCADIPRPIKHEPGFDKFWAPIEERIHAAVAEAFGVSPTMPRSVEEADDRMAVTEMRDLSNVPRPAVTWVRWDLAYPEVIRPWPQKVAESIYLKRFAELTRAVGALK
jgi:hypothetical protein